MSLSWPWSSGPSAAKRAAGDGFDYGFDLIRHPQAAGDWCLRATGACGRRVCSRV